MLYGQRLIPAMFDLIGIALCDEEKIDDVTLRSLDHWFSGRGNDYVHLDALLYQAANKMGVIERLCSESRRVLYKAYRRALYCDMVLEPAIEAVVAMAMRNHLPIVFLKGAAFRGTLYDGSAPRVCADIDFLVKAEHWQRCLELMDSHGQPARANVRRSYTRRRLFESPFVLRDSPVLIEPHRHVTHPILFRVTEAQWWNRSVPHPLFNSAFVRVLSPSGVLSSLAVHYLRDGCDLHHNLVDASYLLRREKIDWAGVVADAQRWGTDGALYALLTAVKRRLGISPPDGILLRLAPAMWRRALFEHLQGQGAGNGGEQLSLGSLALLQMAGASSLRRAFAYLAQQSTWRIRDGIELITKIETR